ncbi:MAG: NADH-ubiquinone oxidoreductase-F iron-sulfur binding region domain-containing protein [bacterium]
MKNKIIVTTGTCGISAGAKKVADALTAKKGIELKTTSCIGMCYLEPTVLVESGDDIRFFSYITDKTEDIDDIVNLHITGVLTDNLKNRMVFEGKKKDLASKLFKGQHRIVLRNSGWIDPLNLQDYLDTGGYKFLSECFNGVHTSEQVLEIVKNSGLRGRGGAGFPTASKWEILKKQQSKEKYVICNGDEGDPGAFMDRAVLEGDPHSVLEGIQLAAFVTGASKCFIYVRAEYPIAVSTINKAIQDAKAKGFLYIPIEVMEGAGAFVCGEETALIASVEGKRGMPRLRPPYPAESGLWEQPTIINNVETFAAVPWIVTNPGEYEKIGYAKSKGTKVFALAGKIKKGGLAEVPFGIKLKDLIYDVGGGILDDKKFKAVQIGGPSGGCLSEKDLNIPIDYETLKEYGVIVGSGGLVVMDQSSCMVDIARFFLSFTAKESCGKCTFCRVGTTRMLDIMNRIVEGRSNADDIDKLKELSDAVSKLSLCGLGQTAPNPVLTTLKYFKEEYEEHIKELKCRAAECKALISYSVISKNCIGCMMCKKACPVNAVYVGRNDAGKAVCIIDNDKCIKCGKCFDACKFKAILKA